MMHAFIGSSIPTQIGSPGGLLIEGFESFTANLPTDGRTWITTVNPLLYTFVQSNSHVTQGSHSGLWTQISSGSEIGTGEGQGGDVLDLVGFTLLQIDIYVDTVVGGQFMQMVVYDNGFNTFDTEQTTPGTTGAFTLNCDLTQWTSGELASMNIRLGPAGAGGAAIFYIDNLRVS